MATQLRWMQCLVLDVKDMAEFLDSSQRRVRRLERLVVRSADPSTLGSWFDRQPINSFAQMSPGQLRRVLNVVELVVAPRSAETAHHLLSKLFEDIRVPAAQNPHQPVWGKRMEMLCDSFDNLADAGRLPGHSGDLTTIPLDARAFPELYMQMERHRDWREARIGSCGSQKTQHAASRPDALAKRSVTAILRT
ncbi:MAG: hypothetical protein IPI58_06130 [Alphaproteobacteria bacterium]|nr:MAG: hypothetical protein IPI58_06130 [Alphaproteobacteria bacterium]